MFEVGKYYYSIEKALYEPAICAMLCTNVDDTYVYFNAYRLTYEINKDKIVWQYKEKISKIDDNGLLKLTRKIVYPNGLGSATFHPIVDSNKEI